MGSGSQQATESPDKQDRKQEGLSLNGVHGVSELIEIVRGTWEVLIVLQGK